MVLTTVGYACRYKQSLNTFCEGKKPWLKDPITAKPSKPIRTFPCLPFSGQVRIRDETPRDVSPKMQFVHQALLRPPSSPSFFLRRPVDAVLTVRRRRRCLPPPRALWRCIFVPQMQPALPHPYGSRQDRRRHRERAVWETKRERGELFSPGLGSKADACTGSTSKRASPALFHTARRQAHNSGCPFFCLVDRPRKDSSSFVRVVVFFWPAAFLYYPFLFAAARLQPHLLLPTSLDRPPSQSLQYV